MTKYRIKKISKGDGEDYYLVQKKTRLFWIGPKIWESYYEGDNDFCLCSTHCFSCFNGYGHQYSSQSTAESVIKRLIRFEKSKKMLKSCIVKEYSDDGEI